MKKNTPAIQWYICLFQMVEDLSGTDLSNALRNVTDVPETLIGFFPRYIHATELNLVETQFTS